MLSTGCMHSSRRGTGVDPGGVLDPQTVLAVLRPHRLSSPTLRQSCCVLGPCSSQQAADCPASQRAYKTVRAPAWRGGGICVTPGLCLKGQQGDLSEHGDNQGQLASPQSRPHRQRRQSALSLPGAQGCLARSDPLPSKLALLILFGGRSLISFGDRVSFFQAGLKRTM